MAREVFGIASAEDVERLNANVDILFQKDQTIATLQTLHITAVKELEGQIEKQRTQLSSLVNLTGTMFGTLLPEVKNRNVLQPMVLFLHGEMATTLTSFRATIQQFLRVIDMLNRGFASPDILPLKELSKALEHIRSQVPSDMRLVYGNSNESLYPYYHNQLTTMLPGKKDIRGTIQIPIADPDNLFKIYKAIPFPTRVGDESGKSRFKWSGTSTYVAMTPNKARFTDLGPWFTPMACLTGPPMVCPTQTIISTDPSTQCLFQILTGDLHQSKGHCPLEAVEEDLIVIRPINEIEWVISTNEPLAVKPSCLDPDDPSLPLTMMHGFTVRGEVIVSVPRHCTASIGNYMVPLRLRMMTGNHKVRTELLDTDLDIQHLLDLKGQALEEDRLHNRFIDAFQGLQDLNSSVNTPDTTSEDIYRIIAKMSNVNEEMQKLQPVWVTHYMSLGGWIFFGLLAFAACIFILKCRSKVSSLSLDHSSIINPRPSAPRVRANFKDDDPTATLYLARTPRTNE